MSHSAFNVGTIETLSSMTSRTMSIAARMDSEEELSAAASELILDYMKKVAKQPILLGFSFLFSAFEIFLSTSSSSTNFLQL